MSLDLIAFFLYIQLVLATCPDQRHMTISSFHVLSTDSYQSSSKTALHDVCKLYFAPASSDGFIVSITQLFLFSHRQPKNTNEIIINSKDQHFIIKPESKIYNYFHGEIEIEMPMNLNFRALVVLTVTKNCSSSDNFRCISNSTVCVSRDYLCDENDNCGEELNCSETKVPLTSFEYDRDALSSSQLMLIGFFVVNLSFILFFLTLSLCSAGYCFSSKFFLKQSMRSRRTFAKYIRDAAKETPKTTPLLPRPLNIDKTCSPPSRKVSAERRQRPSILSRINFEPAPSLREYEPEIEDRSVSPMAELCSPPIHGPELFLRRQTLPALYNTKKVSQKKRAAWKRASVDGARIV